MYKDYLINILTILLLFSLPLILLASSETVYDYSASFNDKEEEMNEIKNYLFRGEPLQGLNEDEENHMKDVKNLITYSQIFLILGFTLFIILFNKNNLIKSCKIHLIISFILGIASFFAFEKLFYYFHIIFFPQGNFTFPESSVLISLFPPEFFLEMGLIWILLTVTISVFTLLLSKYL